MYGSPLARELAVPCLLIPPTPGILCALGMLIADLRHDLVQTRLSAHRDLLPAAAQAIFDPMLAEARRLLDADRVPPDRQRIEMRLDMRYVGQSYELRSGSRASRRPNGRRWSRPSTPNTQAASATATPRRRSRLSASA